MLSRRLRLMMAENQGTGVFSNALHTASNHLTASALIDTKAIWAAARELRAMREDQPKVVVMLESTWQKLNSSLPLAPPLSPPMTFYGLPVESYPTMEELHKRLSELLAAGTKAIFCHENWNNGS